MAPVPAVPGERVVRALEKAGFKVARVAGSHHIMRHPDGRGTTVPVHAGRDVAEGTPKHGPSSIMVPLFDGFRAIVQCQRPRFRCGRGRRPWHGGAVWLADGCRPGTHVRRVPRPRSGASRWAIESSVTGTMAHRDPREAPPPGSRADRVYGRYCASGTALSICAIKLAA